MQRNVPLETMYSIWVHRTAGWRKAVSVRRRFINFNGRAPTVAELAEQLGLVLPDKEELLSWYEDQYEQFLRAKRNAPKKDGQRGRGRDRVLNPRSCRRRDSAKDIVLKPTEALPKRTDNAGAALIRAPIGSATAPRTSCSSPSKTMIGMRNSLARALPRPCSAKGPW